MLHFVIVARVWSSFITPGILDLVQTQALDVERRFYEKPELEACDDKLVA
jgi:hypothetical protein